MSNNLTLNLAQLQNKIKRDPSGFRDEYESQVHRFKTSLELQQLHPENDHTVNEKQIARVNNFIFD
mgnify:CR=1 FL=1